VSPMSKLGISHVAGVEAADSSPSEVIDTPLTAILKALRASAVRLTRPTIRRPCSRSRPLLQVRCLVEVAVPISEDIIGRVEAS
jgi:hypothetical protein